jgi:hypothetical protein
VSLSWAAKRASGPFRSCTPGARQLRGPEHHEAGSGSSPPNLNQMYQAKTDRELPVIRLTPTGDAV